MSHTIGRPHIMTGTRNREQKLRGASVPGSLFPGARAARRRFPIPYGIGLGLGHGHGHGSNPLLPASPRTAASRTSGSGDFSRSVRIASDRPPERSSARICAFRARSVFSTRSADRIAFTAAESPIWPSAHADLSRTSSSSSVRASMSPRGASFGSSWPNAHAAVPRTRVLLSLLTASPRISTAVADQPRRRGTRVHGA